MTKNSGMESPARVVVMGMPYWTQVAAEMLCRAGFAAEVTELKPVAHRLLRPLAWRRQLACHTLRHVSALHYVAPWGSARLIALARLLGKRVVAHWIGTDVASLLAAVARGERRGLRSLQRAPHAHFADSPALIEELGRVGIRAALFRLLPAQIESDLLPMPPQPAVLSYWVPGRRTFYGGDIVTRLAQEFPQVEFYICGADQSDGAEVANLHYVGRVQDVDAVYRRASILIRMPEHDSLSAMVLELLVRGRWVICNYEFPYTETARSFEQARAALLVCLQRSGHNLAGREYVLEHFSPTAESLRIRSDYYRALGRAGDQTGCGPTH